MSHSMMVLGLLCVGVVVFCYRMVQKPELILYSLAFVVSIVAININVGGTIYLSRILLMICILVAIMRYSIGIRDGFDWRIDKRISILFTGTIAIQSISTLFSGHMPAALRQQAIYISMMLTFLMVVVLGTNISVIKKAVYVYLVFAVFHGLLGIYQFFGVFMNWPMYQQLLVGLPVSNPTGVDLERALSTRVFGLLSDTNQYAAYLVGAILIAFVAYVWNKRSILPYLVISICSISLLFTFSRSGMITLVVMGIPLILYLLMKNGFKLRAFKKFVAVAVVLVILGMGISSFWGAKIESYTGPIQMVDMMMKRVDDFTEGTKPGGTEYGVSSVGRHFYTRMQAIDAWIDRPFFGVGLGVNESPWYSETFNAYWGGAHSHHLDALGQTGLIGALFEWIFMWYVGMIMWRGIKRSKRKSEEKLIMIGLFSAYMSILFGNLLYHSYLNGFVWFIVGCGVALSRAIVKEECVSNSYCADSSI